MATDGLGGGLLIGADLVIAVRHSNLMWLCFAASVPLF